MTPRATKLCPFELPPVRLRIPDRCCEGRVLLSARCCCSAGCIGMGMFSSLADNAQLFGVYAGIIFQFPFHVAQRSIQYTDTPYHPQLNVQLFVNTT